MKNGIKSIGFEFYSQLFVTLVRYNCPREILIFSVNTTGQFVLKLDTNYTQKSLLSKLLCETRGVAVYAVCYVLLTFSGTKRNKLANTVKQFGVNDS